MQPRFGGGPSGDFRMASEMDILREIPQREHCFLFIVPDIDVSIDDLIHAVELTAGGDSNAEQATRLMVAEGFRVKQVKNLCRGSGPPSNLCKRV